MSKKQEYIIDVEKAIEVHNKKFPDRKPLSKSSLAKATDTTYQTMLNYQSSKTPDVVRTIKKIVDLTGIEINELIKEKK